MGKHFGLWLGRGGREGRKEIGMMELWTGGKRWQLRWQSELHRISDDYHEDVRSIGLCVSVGG